MDGSPVCCRAEQTLLFVFQLLETSLKNTHKSSSSCVIYVLPCGHVCLSVCVFGGGAVRRNRASDWFIRSQEKGETALHLAVLLADRTSLHILDFLAQNW